MAVKVAGGRSPAEVEFVPPLHEFLARSAETVVVVAPWGAGTSFLVQELEIQAALPRWPPGGRVAVRVPLEEWHAGQSLQAWIGDHLCSRYSLRRPDAVALVKAGLVHPLVERVDELATGLRGEFLDAVQSLPFPVLLTSRSAEAARDIPVVELSALTPADHLRRWPGVAEAVRAEPTAPLAAVLEDPVGRRLFFEVHEDDGHDPAILLDRNTFPDPQAVESHLIAELPSGRRHALRRIAHFARGAPDGHVAWWRLADSVPRAGFLLATTGFAIATAVVAVVLAMPAGLGSVSLPLRDWGRIAAVVATGLAMALASLSRPRLPVAVEWDRWRKASTGWLAGGPAAGLAIGVAAVVAGRPWTSLPGAILAGLCVGVLGAQATLIVERGDETRLDAPGRILAQDRAVAGVRIFTAAAAAYFSAAALTGRFALDGSGWMALVLLGAILGTTGSTYVRYKIAVWTLLPGRRVGHDAVGALSAVPDLVGREGGVFVFRDEAVREHLAATRLEPVYSSAWNASEFVRSRRRRMAEKACRDADVAGAISLGEVQGFVDAVAEGIEQNLTAIVASTAAARQQYAAAKRRYAESALKMPIETAVTVQETSELLPALGFFLTAFAPITFALDQLGLSWTTALGASLGSAALAALAWQLVRRSPDQELRESTAMIGLGTFGALVYELIMLAQPLPAVLRPFVPSAGFLACAGSWAAWGLTARLRSLLAKVWSDEPADWPSGSLGARTAAARAEAETALDAWIGAAIERGVAPLVAQRLNSVRSRSYAKELPEADVGKLGDVTDVAQYVPTETSGRLDRMMKVMTRGAIGISGPRGVGKSTVLKMFGDLGFGAARGALTVVVPAPTNYGSRDFLVHLYSTVCGKVVSGSGEPRRRRRHWPWLVVSATGVLVAAGAWQWPALATAAQWFPPHWRAVTMTGGIALALGPAIVWRVTTPTRKPTEDQIVTEARKRLAGLRFLVTTTVTRSATVKPPAVAELGGSHALAQAAQAKTLPELVDEFRQFLSLLTSRSRVVVCVDELDKIASAAEAERFLNDIKAVFGVENCFFLVAVSEDALASFSRRSLAVRTAFDSAFDTVVTVRRFELAETRRLLVQRVSALPEPFVWLCHAMSGGLPRDLNRTVRELYDLTVTHGATDLGALSRELVKADLDAVTDGLAARLADRFDGLAIRLRQHILSARRLAPASAELLAYRPMRWAADAPDDLNLVYTQFRCYLAYAAAILRAFGDHSDAVIAALRDTDADPIRHLAQARVWLALDPVAAAAHVDDWQTFEKEALDRAGS